MRYYGINLKKSSLGMDKFNFSFGLLFDVYHFILQTVRAPSLQRP